MISEIKYNGYSANPSDYDCLDGDLAVVVGAIPEHGALKPVAQPNPIFTLPSGYKVVITHETSAFKHYIIQDNSNNLYWRGESGNLKKLNYFGKAEIYQITSIGNTVVVLCDDGLHYILWKADDKTYIYLGNKIPECPISFGLWGKGCRYSELQDDGGTPYGTFEINYESLDDKKTIASQVLAKVNKFIAKVSTDDNKFIYPFFVRYAYRLYDDSLSHHSAPILMLPSTSTNPMVYAPSGTVGDSSATLDIYSIAATLDYQPLLSEEQRLGLNNWKDIVKSVDIFVSAPIYTYDQSGTECEYRGGAPLNSTFHGRFIPKSGDVSDIISSTYQMWWYYNLYRYDNNADLGRGFDIPAFPTSEVDAKIRDCSAFYLLTSIDLKDLPYIRSDVKIEDGTLSSLVVREAMTDDYQTHDTLIPSYAQTYNSRLNIANIERKLFAGYDTAAQVAYCNGYLQYDYTTNTVATDPQLSGNEYVKMFTKVQSDKTITVENTCATSLNGAFWNYPYLFYPDVAAKSITVYRDSYHHNTLTLTPHSFLNGSVYFNGLFPLDLWDETYLAPSPDANPTISLPNKIYTSEVNNPFFFPLLGINTVGTGEIVGISTAAKALSEGQFGQFPLYAFTTDGVWALEVSSTGSYSARQPITRDICLNADSITQIDSSVLFATERGIMLLSGSQSICISDVLDASAPLSISELPLGEKLIEDIAKLSRNNATYVPFATFIKKCKMAYDYIQQRIIVINPDYAYAYIYSFDSKAWGMIPSSLKSIVPAYPEALAMDSLNRLVDLSAAETASNIPIFFATRPIKLDRDMLKTVDTVIQRGYFKRGHIKVVLYGSRDMFNWSVVHSSTDHYLRGFRGTPYKYFRIAVMGSLDAQESISGCTIQYTLRQTNQPR